MKGFYIFGLIFIILSHFFEGTFEIILTSLGIAILIYTRYKDYVNNN
jgi:hypothetical protein